MGWPEALLGAFNLIQVCFLAWIAQRQLQVKRDLNGHQDAMVGAIVRMREALDTAAVSRLRPVPGPRAPGVIDDDS